MNKGKGGFSLLEVIIAMLIMSIAVPGIFCTIVYATKIKQEAKNLRQAVYQAQTMIERTRAETWLTYPLGTSPALSIGTHTFREVGLSSTPAITNGSLSDWYYVVSPIGGCKKGVVTVKWEE